MKTFDEQAAYGLPYERLIAQTAALLLFPERPDLELFRLPAHSVIDFFLTRSTETRRGAGGQAALGAINSV
jgi:hypothetical protein